VRLEHRSDCHRAFRWREMPENGTHATIAEIATAEKINETYVGRVLRMTLRTVEAILNGRHPAGLLLNDPGCPSATFARVRWTPREDSASLSGEGVSRLPRSGAGGELSGDDPQSAGERPRWLCAFGGGLAAGQRQVEKSCCGTGGRAPGTSYGGEISLSRGLLVTAPSQVQPTLRLVVDNTGSQPGLDPDETRRSAWSALRPRSTMGGEGRS
jgi:hypothetical protein